MASGKSIRAGEAFWEATIRDKTGPGLQAVKQKLSAFGSVLGGTLAANVISSVFSKILDAARGIYDFARRSVMLFMEISKQRGLFGVDLPGAEKAKALTNAWIGFQAAIQAVMFTIGSAVAGPLTAMLNTFATITVHIAQFIASLTVAGGAFQAFTLSLTIVWQSAMVALEQALFNTIKFISDTIKGAMLGLAAAVKSLEGVTGSPLGSKEITASANSLGRGGGMYSFGALGADIERRKQLMREAMDGILAMAGITGDNQESLNQPQGPRVLGSSSGTFSGRGASYLGIGGSGGMLTKDDETHKLLIRTINILQKIAEKGGAAFK